MNLEDVAKKAGVSRSTVSRVINNDPDVNTKTRQRVLAVIEQVGYTPNPAARALVTSRSQIIGVAVPQTINVFFGDNSYYPMLLQGIAEAINRHNYAMLFWLAEDNEARENFAHRVSRHRQSDGLIITSITSNDPLFEQLRRQKRRFVMVETPPSHADEVTHVTIDNRNASINAVQHLIDIGRTRIAHISGDIVIKDAADRYEGYRTALEKSNLPVDESLIQFARFNSEAGYEAMKKLLPHHPDAVFCGGDVIAMGALNALHEMGKRVPEDVAVVGFDDLNVATQLNPPLTTVRHHVQTVGSTAANLLIDQIEGRLEHPYRVVLPTELIVRESSVRQA